MEKNNRRSLFANFVNNVEEKLSDLVTLEIKTIVGDYRVTQDEQIYIRQEGDFKIIKSTIGLLDGEITTLMSNDLIDERFDWLRDFHAQREEKGHEIIARNIEAIRSLFQLFRETKKLNAEKSYRDRVRIVDRTKIIEDTPHYEAVESAAEELPEALNAPILDTEDWADDLLEETAEDLQNEEKKGSREDEIG